MSTALGAGKKSIESPDEVRVFDKGRMEIVTLGDTFLARTIFQPGWKWSESVKPIAQTPSCEVAHRLYVVSGSLHIVMDDGSVLDISAGDVVAVDRGHDAWVTGDEPCVMLDFGGGGADYAKATT
jgi:mannose-6-phosphate isomerase-like protein (cupin superfamily)